LISVYDKTGLIGLAQALAGSGAELVSTGSTASALEAAGLPVTRVEQLTEFPECLDGRIKTLHPRVHAGLLADVRLDSHVTQLADLGIEPFDLLVSNLYPFRETVASGADFDGCVEQIDIGGPAMVRAAAKNHASVAVVISPSAYDLVREALAAGGFTLPQRRKLAAEAFAEIAGYDIAVAEWFAAHEATYEQAGSLDAAHPQPARLGGWPAFAGLGLRHTATLRYGENPHQAAAVYVDPAHPVGLAQAEQVSGKEMSYNNYVDADAAWRTVHDFSDPCVAIIKHANPCGIAVGADVAEAHRKAHACDPVSAFGGVIAANRPVTAALAAQLEGIFTEVIVAPSFDDGALELLTAKKNLRVLVAPDWQPQPAEWRQISGGVLVQMADRLTAPGDAVEEWRLVSGAALAGSALADLAFAWKAVRAVKSNAILLAHDGASVGVGMGQVNRVDSARLAVVRAGERAVGSVAASDAFFPFPDGFLVLAAAGVRAVVQPGGSLRDDEVIGAAHDAGVTMYLTGARHFYH
jgi:phosphoribosylaminoimidazolecarboxamide formyltransferase/IMP cyclohydrolase